VTNAPARFDFEETFGDDYLHFYLAGLTDERNEIDAAVVRSRLDLQRGERVLDAPCGHGRITTLLAGAGFDMVGVDVTERFLELARGTNPAIDYRHGDIRSLPCEDGEFDAAFSWFTSFGYFDDDSNRAVLREYARVLRPGGRLLIEMLHRDSIIRRYAEPPTAVLVQRGDDLMIDQSTFDPMTGRIGTDRITVRNGRVARSHHSVRLLSVSEWFAWLGEAGFDDVQPTDHDGQPLTIASNRIVVVATKVATKAR